MCRLCRQQCRGIRFDFQNRKLYHEYCNGALYTRPDLICFFNPALHQPGFQDFDTWPKTIRSALDTRAPVLVTSCTENAALLDIARIEKLNENDVEILKLPKLNPFFSTQPERNFRDDFEPITFKNHYFFIFQKVKDLIEL